MGLKIIPVCLDRSEVSRAVVQSLKGFFEHMEIACIAWLIVGGEKTILVDSGPSSNEWAEKYHRKLTRTEDQLLIPALAKKGYRPHDIDMIINTHLHWDHVYGNNDIPNVPIYVQRAEVRYAAAPMARDANTYEADLKSPIFSQFYDRLHILDGDCEIISGVRIILTPGHTPGSQTVLVDTEKGIHAIASDTLSLSESLNSDPPWPPGIFYDLEVWYHSIKRIQQEAVVILPGHDVTSIDRVYPE